jgi:hypothetical protein
VSALQRPTDASQSIARDSTSGGVADHCYCVLGFPEAASTQHIVLPNPLGPSRG